MSVEPRNLINMSVPWLGFGRKKLAMNDGKSNKVMPIIEVAATVASKKVLTDINPD